MSKMSTFFKNYIFLHSEKKPNSAQKSTAYIHVIIKTKISKNNIHLINYILCKMCKYLLLP